jgi:hypothetical protein
MSRYSDFITGWTTEGSDFDFRCLYNRLETDGYRELLPGEKQPARDAREADNSRAFSAEVKNAWSCASAHFHGVMFI